METVLRGLTTLSFYADDLEAATKWYSEFLNTEPYFNVPGYVEFRIGDYQHELGNIDSKYALNGATEKTADAIIYRRVDNLQAILDKLLSSGTTLYQPIMNRSGGKGNFVTASFIDPFGNILGIMINQYYLGVLEKQK